MVDGALLSQANGRSERILFFQDLRGPDCQWSRVQFRLKKLVLRISFHSKMSDSPTIMIFVKRSAMDESTVSRLRTIKSLLLDRGIGPRALRIVDVSYEFEEQRRIELESNNRGQWPVIYANGIAVGQLDDLREWIRQGKIGTAVASKVYEAAADEKQELERALERALQDERQDDAELIQEEAEELDMRLTQIFNRMKLQKHLDQLQREKEQGDGAERVVAATSSDSIASSSASSSSSSFAADADDDVSSLSSPPQQFDRRFPMSDRLKTSDDDIVVPRRAERDGAEPQELQLGVISSALIPVEHAVTGISTVLSSASTYLGSYIWGAQQQREQQREQQQREDQQQQRRAEEQRLVEQQQPPIENDNDDDDDDDSSLSLSASSGSSASSVSASSSDDRIEKVEFLVIRVNWYYRRQHRLLRLGAKHYSRIDPESGDVRATYAYNTIAQITINSPISFTVVFLRNSFNANADTSDEFYECIEMEKLVSVLCYRSKTFADWKIPIDRL
jgi:glutaredoxin